MLLNLSALLATTILLQTIRSQSNPECQAKRFLCSPTPLENSTCLFIADEQEKWNYLQPCNQTGYYCPYETASYGKNATCQPVNSTESKYPGESCAKADDCLSKNCTASICYGAKKGDSCQIHADCDSGFFCFKEKQKENLKLNGTINGTCESQKEFDQSCTEDYECVNNCACSMNRCAFYYSALNGIPADNPYVCESGYIKDGKCGAGLISKNKGQPCSMDEDCEFVDSENKVIGTGKCECGYNAGAFSYCALGTGDSEFSDMLRAFKYITVNNYYCHTNRRFGPCPYIYEEDYQDFMKAKTKFEKAPVLIMNDICTAKNINYFYWKYYIENTTITTSL